MENPPLPTRNDRIGTGNSWYDVFDDALGERPRHAFNAKLCCSRGCLLKQPLDVVGIICIQLLI